MFLCVQGAQAGCTCGSKHTALNPVVQSELAVLCGREVGGMRGVAVKCIDITENADCEGGILAPDGR